MREVKKILADGNVPSNASVSLMTSCKTKLIDSTIAEKLSGGTEEDRLRAERDLYAMLYEEDKPGEGPLGSAAELSAKEGKSPQESSNLQLIETDQTANTQNKIINGGVNFNQSFRLCLRVPHNKSLCPVLEVTVYHFPWGSSKALGTGTYSLASALAWFYGDEDNDDYKKKWKEFFQINKKKGEDEKEDKPKKVKVPKVKPENQLLYMDDLVYEMPPEEEILSKKLQKKKNWRERYRDLDQPGADDEHESLLKQDNPAESMPFKEPKVSKKAKRQQKREEAIQRQFEVISEYISPEDLDVLDENEKKLIVEDLINKGYIDGQWDSEEEDYEEPEEQAGSMMAPEMAKSSVMNPGTQPALQKENSQMKQSQLGASVDAKADNAPQQEKFDLDLQEKPESDAGKSDKVDFPES